MNSVLPLFIGLRYVRGKHRNGFLSFVSLLSFIAMALGVMALIVVLSVMNGFDREIKTRVLNVVPHAVVRVKEGVSDWRVLGEQVSGHNSVLAYAPYVEGYGMLSAAGINKGVLVQGIEPKAESRVTEIADFTVAGNISSLEPGSFGIVLGSLLARSLGVFIGDSVILSVPELSVTPAGAFPRYKRFYVEGIFQVGAQVDNGLALIHYRDAQKLYRLGEKVHGVRLLTADAFAIDHALLNKLPQHYEAELTSWAQSMGELFQAIKMEKAVVGTLLAAIIAVAAFNIIASLVLMVGEKRADIAVLRTLGASSSLVSKIFVVQGCAVGIAGVFVGVVAGCLTAYFIGDILHWFEQLMGFYVFDPNVYFISKLPSHLLWQDVVVVSTLGILFSVMATLYPSFRAGKILPAEALRYEP